MGGEHEVWRSCAVGVVGWVGGWAAAVVAVVRGGGGGGGGGVKMCAVVVVVVVMVWGRFMGCVWFGWCKGLYGCVRGGVVRVRLHNRAGRKTASVLSQVATAAAFARPVGAGWLHFVAECDSGEGIREVVGVWELVVADEVEGVGGVWLFPV